MLAQVNQKSAFKVLVISEPPIALNQENVLRQTDGLCRLTMQGFKRNTNARVVKVLFQMNFIQFISS